MSTLPPAILQYQLEHIRDDKSKEILSALGVTLGFAIITVLLRFVSRHITRAGLAWDDWTVGFGLVCAIGYVVGQSICVAHGLGKHLILVTDPISIAKAVKASIIFYIVSLAATKVSILLLYRRIFPQRGFHAILWGVGIFVLAFTVANVLTIIFECRPISAAWMRFIEAKCINTDAAILTVAVFTVVTDCIILGLPLPFVWKLQLPRVQKLQLTALFLLGVFATGVSIYRTTQVTGIQHTDFSYDSTNRSIWSGVEICAAIVCANLATLRPILSYLRTGQATPAYAPSTQKTSKGVWSSTCKSNWRKWTLRHSGTPAGRPGCDDTFHRLIQYPAARSTDDVERQKVGEYFVSDVGSPRMPDTAYLAARNRQDWK